MNTQQIESILSQDPYVGSSFYGVFARDQIPYFENGSCVINTAPSTQDTGHWIALYVVGDEAEYFDSYGGEVMKSLKQKWKGKSWTSNPVALQSPLSAVCGQHCIYYLLHRARDIPMSSIVMSFGTDVDYNDQTVYQFVQDYYEFDDLKLLDTGGVITQLAKACVQESEIHLDSSTAPRRMARYGK